MYLFFSFPFFQPFSPPLSRDLSLGNLTISQSLILTRSPVLAIHDCRVYACECERVSVDRPTTVIFILIETAATEIIGDNDVCDCVEHELNVVGISSASHVAVDLLSG